MNSGIEGIDIDMLKLFLLLYTDGIVIFANNPDTPGNVVRGNQKLCKWNPYGSSR